MNYIKNKPYCIEERAKKVFGLTEVFEFAGYLLEDGTMLNFSYEGYQRDEDHRIIGQFYKKACGTLALDKFMRRGNIRVMCHKDSYMFEFAKKPTRAQIIKMKEAEKDARSLGYYFTLEKDDSKGKVVETYDSVMDYVREVVCG